MGVALGWQRMHNSVPYISGNAWNDGVSRNGNTVSYSINLCMKVERPYGYWDYSWFVDMQIGSNVSNNRKVKGDTGWHKTIGGKEYYQSTYNGNFTGSTSVSGKATSIQLRAQFSDSHGNRGPNVYWNIPIPQASSMSNIASSVTNIETDRATINASINNKGNYSSITSWKLEYGINNYTEHTITASGDVMSKSWNLTDLLADTQYRYRVTVYSSSGYSKEYTGTFRTEEEIIAHKITETETLDLIGYVITPDGRQRKIKRIEKVDPL